MLNNDLSALVALAIVIIIGKLAIRGLQMLAQDKS